MVIPSSDFTHVPRDWARIASPHEDQRGGAFSARSGSPRVLLAARSSTAARTTSGLDATVWETGADVSATDADASVVVVDAAIDTSAPDGSDASPDAAITVLDAKQRLLDEHGRHRDAVRGR